MPAANHFPARPRISENFLLRRPRNGARLSATPASRWSDQRHHQNSLIPAAGKPYMIGGDTHCRSGSMQLVAERQSTDTIQAEMTYIVDPGVPPVRYIDWPEMADKKIPPQYRQHMVTIRNGRPLRDTFRLDTHGFVF